MPAIAIRTRINRHQPMVKTYRDFVRENRLRANPETGVINQISEHGSNIPRFNTDISWRGTEFTRQPPYILEHSFV